MMNVKLEVFKRVVQYTPTRHELLREPQRIKKMKTFESSALHSEKSREMGSHVGVGSMFMKSALKAVEQPSQRH